ncbi:uncharacterized protein LOC132289188 [Cornus florida]|uniref:uncharacterized protein LOC132289188 n=1 Tax=Cornus florida TaxID=4283 RepID=UPI00289CCA76|nr:uncharacterized protein LOC132289188 [Cornus florida]
MAEEEVETKVNLPRSDPQRHLPFVEVCCKSSGNTRRFAAGTEAGFALGLINRKLDSGIGSPPALHIEAVKEGEEPVSFGPNSVLVDYGDGWKLQTVTEIQALRKDEQVQSSTTTTHISSVKGLDGSRPMKSESQPVSSFLYIGKILIAFILMFVLGAIFTLALENLPGLILLINSSM